MPFPEQPLANQIRATGFVLRAIEAPATLAQLIALAELVGLDAKSVVRPLLSDAIRWFESGGLPNPLPGGSSYFAQGGYGNLPDDTVLERRIIANAGESGEGGLTRLQTVFLPGSMPSFLMLKQGSNASISTRLEVAGDFSNQLLDRLVASDGGKAVASAMLRALREDPTNSLIDVVVGERTFSFQRAPDTTLDCPTNGEWFPAAVRFFGDPLESADRIGRLQIPSADRWIASGVLTSAWATWRSGFDCSIDHLRELARRLPDGDVEWVSEARVVGEQLVIGPPIVELPSVEGPADLGKCVLQAYAFGRFEPPVAIVKERPEPTFSVGPVNRNGRRFFEKVPHHPMTTITFDQPTDIDARWRRVETLCEGSGMKAPRKAIEKATRSLRPDANEASVVLGSWVLEIAKVF